MSVFARKKDSVRGMAFAALTLLAATGCMTTQGATTAGGALTPAPVRQAAEAKGLQTKTFEQDRAAILAMAGAYRVTFDFRETVSFVEGYELKEPYVTGGDELVIVLEDRGDFISLQHILVVGGDEKVAIKHWRQDWRYEPVSILSFIGGNAWEMQNVNGAARAGRWSQTVYQVDDSPRYGGLGVWSHEDGVSQWSSDREWRPLPRRDMTKRDDYHAVAAVNTHAVTPTGWVHEQNNQKLILRDAPRILVREIGVNTYDKTDGVDFSAATDYWDATKDYWAAVRDAWTGLETQGAPFALTLKGEPAALYTELFKHAQSLQDDEATLDEAVKAAQTTITTYTTKDVAPLQERLR